MDASSPFYPPLRSGGGGPCAAGWRGRAAAGRLGGEAPSVTAQGRRATSSSAAQGKRKGPLGALVVCLLSLFAVPAFARPADTLVVGLQLEPPTLDPTSGAAAAIKEVAFQTVFEGLVRLGPGGAVRPWLAQRWSVSPDGLTYRFDLRPHVRFQDGAPLDARAVKFSLDRARAAASINSQKPRFQVIASVETPDPLSVVVRLKRRSSTFLQVLGWGDAAILSPRSATRDATVPIGTGPFRFEAWRRGEAVSLARNLDYWGAGPHVARLVFRFLADPTAAEAALKAGDVDAFPGFPAPEAIAGLARDPRFTVRVGPSEGETLVALNERSGPLADVRVRRALAYAIDRRAVIQAAMFGYGQPIGSHYPPQDPGYVDLTGLYPHDPARARALLAQAGYPHGLALTLKLPPPSYARRSGEVIAAQLAQAGVRVRLQDVEWAQWLADVFGRHDYQMTIVSHVEPLDYDIYGRDDYYFGYASPAAKALLAQVEQAPDATTRLAALQGVQRQIASDAVNLFLFEMPVLGVWSARLRDIWAPTPVGVFDYARARFTASGARGGEGAAGGGGVVAVVLGAALLAALVAAGRAAGPGYLAARAGGLAATLLVASLVVFVLVQVAPGDPARAMMGLNADPASLHAVRLELGLEGPAWRRYLGWLAGLAHGDFGASYTYRVPVGPLIAERLAVSAPLALYALILSTAMALAAALASAGRPGGALDRTLGALAALGLATPSFWVGMMAILLFAEALHLLPAGGFPGWSAGLGPGLAALTLPALALAVPQAAVLTRVLRGELIAAAGAEYALAARARGLSAGAVLLRHALPNALPPALTVLGLQAGFLLAGAVVVETLFALPGLGRLVFQAITQRDLIVVQAAVLVLVAAVAGAGVLADLAATALDPRLADRRR